MPTLAEILRQTGYSQDGELAVPASVEPTMTSILQKHIASLPQQLATNQATLDNAIGSWNKTDFATGQPNANYRPEAINELTQLMPNMAGMIIGPQSKLWNQNNALKADELLKKGVSPEDIWKQTGTAISPSGNLVQEISDAQAIAKNIPKHFWQSKEQNLENLLEHPALYEGYPAIKGLKTTLNKDLPDVAELTNKGIGYKQTTNEELTPSLLHEIQHSIQLHEKWPTGSNPTAKLSAEEEKHWVNTVVDELKQNLNNEGYSNKELLDYAKKLALSPEGKQERYRRLAGEVEARMTEARAKLSPEERLLNYPFKEGQYGLDVEPSKIITRKQLLEQKINSLK